MIVLPADTGFGLAEFVTLKSACPAPATAIFTVAELLFRLISRVVVVSVPVSVMMVPAAVPAFTFTVTTNVLTEPGRIVGSVHPAANEVQVHPEGMDASETNVVLVGMASLKFTLLQALGPLLVTIWV